MAKECDSKTCDKSSCEGCASKKKSAEHAGRNECNVQCKACDRYCKW